MAIQTDAQRQQAVAFLKSGTLTDEQERKALAAVMAYDRLRGEAPAGAVPVESIQLPPRRQPDDAATAPIMRARTPIPGRSSEEVTLGRLQNEAIERGVGRFFQGAGDLAKRFTSRMSPEDREVLARQRLQEQAEFDLEQQAQARVAGVSPESLNDMQMIGRMAPEIAVGGLGGLLKTVPRRLLAEAGLSGLSAAIESPLSDDTAQNAMVWSGIGSTVGLATEVPGLIEGLVFRDIKRATNAFDTDRGFELGDEFGVDLSLAEASVDEKVARVESAVAVGVEGPKRDFLRRRQAQLSESFFRLTNQLNPKNLSLRTVAGTLSDGYTKHVRELQNIATKNMRDTLADAADSVGAQLDKRGRIVGGRPVLMPRNLLEEIESIQQAQSRVPLVSGPEADANVRGVLEKMFDENGNPMPMLLGDIEVLWSALSKAAYSGGGDVARANLTAADRLGVRNLLTALMEDIDKTEAVIGQRGEALAALKAAREQYHVDKKPINALANTAFNKVLSNIGDINGESFVNSLLKLETEDITKVMRIADMTKPGLANAIRGRVFAGLLEKYSVRSATSTARKVVDEIDVPALFNEFSSMPSAKLRALIPIDVSDPVLRRAQAGISVLQRIAQGPNVAPAQGIRSMTQRIENVAINAVSQNSFFISRLLAGELSPNWLEKMMYTREGLEAWAGLGGPSVTRAQAVAAVTSMARLLHESDAEVEAARKAVAERRLKDMQRTTSSVGF